MSIAIRQACIDDAAAIARVQIASWRTTYRGIVPNRYLESLDVEVRTARWKEAFAAPMAVLFVAEAEGEIFGFISGGKLREPIGDCDGELYAIYLLREWQGQGIGRRLTQKLAAALLGAGYQSMAVWVLARNPAVDFYKRLGALPLAAKTIEIGGAQLEEVALGWPHLEQSFPNQASAAKGQS